MPISREELRERAQTQRRHNPAGAMVSIAGVTSSGGSAVLPPTGSDPVAPTPGPSSNGTGPPAKLEPSSLGGPPGPGPFDELRTLAESFEDAQKARIAIENRLRSGTVPAGPVADALDSLEHAEKKLGLAMRQNFRRTAPAVSAWVNETPGVGEHLTARLLGAIGDPLIATPHRWEGEGEDRILVAGEPFVRNLAKLWAYCGHGDPNRRRRKGMTAEDAFALGNPRAKMIVHLLAESAMKVTGAAGRRRSPYRDVYDVGRARYEEREDWTDGHRHAAALRLVGKEILRDLWRISHADHEEALDHG